LPGTWRAPMICITNRAATHYTALLCYDGSHARGEQHGHLSAVGFDMYLRLLEETVQELSGAALQIKFHPGSKIEPARLMALVASGEGAQFTPAGVLRLPLGSASETPAGVLEFLRKALDTLAAGD